MREKRSRGGDGPSKPPRSACGMPLSRHPCLDDSVIDMRESERVKLIISLKAQVRRKENSKGPKCCFPLLFGSIFSIRRSRRLLMPQRSEILGNCHWICRGSSFPSYIMHGAAVCIRRPAPDSTAEVGRKRLDGFTTWFFSFSLRLFGLLSSLFATSKRLRIVCNRGYPVHPFPVIIKSGCGCCFAIIRCH